jgi:hypothetical protein
VNGFLPFGSLISAQRAEQLGDVLDMIASGAIAYPPELIRWEPAAEQIAVVTERKRLVYQIRYPHRHIPMLLEHATDPVTLDAVEDLIGPDIVLYNTQALLKAAFHDTSQPWHQDLRILARLKDKTPFRRRAVISHYMPLNFTYVGPARELPALHVVRGKETGRII